VSWSVFFILSPRPIPHTVLGLGIVSLTMVTHNLTIIFLFCLNKAESSVFSPPSYVRPCKLNFSSHPSALGFGARQPLLLKVINGSLGPTPVSVLTTIQGRPFITNWIPLWQWKQRTLWMLLPNEEYTDAGKLCSDRVALSIFQWCVLFLIHIQRATHQSYSKQ
jgi:hypothetical protein